MNEKQYKRLDMLTDSSRMRIRVIGKSILVGLGAGFCVGVFRYLLSLSEVIRPHIFAFVEESTKAGEYEILFLYLMSFVVMSWLITLIVKREPMCTGSGIPQIKGILAGHMHMRWFSVLVSKIIGGVMVIGAGLSLGREGPSVQIGACVGQGMTRSAKRTRLEKRILMTAGAGAGLAGAFNAPLAGVIFCLEELQKNISSLVLLSAITAAITATAVTGIAFGALPVFSLGYLLPLPLNMIGIVLGLGLFVGCLGRFFTRALLISMASYDKLGLQGVRKAMVPLLMAAGLGFVLPEILGGGGTLIDSLVVSDYSLSFLCVLFVGKFLFTIICFGSGLPGGIFLPMLVLGAVSGGIFAQILIQLGIMPAMYFTDFIVLGMAAYFSVVSKSPVTGSVLIMEMTGSFSHMLALMVVSIVAYIVSDFTKGQPVYDVLLARMLKRSR